MAHLVFGILYLSLGALAMTIGLLLKDKQVAKICIHSSVKVLEENQYVRKHRLFCLVTGLYSLFAGLFLISSHNMDSLGLLNLPLLFLVILAQFVKGKYFSDK